MTRAEMAAVEIRQSTGNTNVVVRHLDLSSLLSVRRFAREFIASETRLDILINNAGRRETNWVCKDGSTIQLFMF